MFHRNSNYGFCYCYSQIVFFVFFFFLIKQLVLFFFHLLWINVHSPFLSQAEGSYYNSPAYTIQRW